MQLSAIVALVLSAKADPNWINYSIIGLGLLIILVAIAQMTTFSKVKIMPQPHPGAVLMRTGIYRYVRHPMYTGVIMATLGLMLTNTLCWRILLWVLLIIVLLLKIQLEEKLLHQKFPDYASYAAVSKKLIPFTW